MSVNPLSTTSTIEPLPSPREAIVLPLSPTSAPEVRSEPSSSGIFVSAVSPTSKVTSRIYVGKGNSLCGRISKCCCFSKCLVFLYRCTIVLPLLVKLVKKIYNYVTGKTPLTMKEYIEIIETTYSHHERIIKAVKDLTDLTGSLKKTKFSRKIDALEKKRLAIFRHLAESAQNPGEARIIQDMSALASGPEEFKKFLMGAYILIPGEQHYNLWSQVVNKRKRVSSHASDRQQYGIGGNFVKEALFGRITKHGRVFTWIQLEKNPVNFCSLGGLKSSFFHCIDFCKYRWTGHNQGPFGTTSHTERSNPLHVTLISKVSFTVKVDEVSDKEREDITKYSFSERREGARPSPTAA